MVAGGGAAKPPDTHKLPDLRREEQQRHLFANLSFPANEPVTHACRGNTVAVLLVGIYKRFAVLALAAVPQKQELAIHQFLIADPIA